ncbi:glycosyltransferase family 87 protein [Edaphobacter aggregans]|uniref:glycosyltransferase family 87 protein n=1 Tax=Edaphobacter aggregans TaxID=570835 RepID=UPI000554C130|nr:glycosyltransferase family 87 protein [Edaphobacter aggregans]
MQAGSIRFVSSRLLRDLVAVWLAGAFGVFAFAGIMGLGALRWVAVLLSVGVAAGVGWVSWKRPVVPLEEKAASRALSIVFVLAAIVSLIQLARLCVFIVNPAAVGYALGPSRGMGLPTSHLCTTAYFVAAQSIATGPNIYDEFTLYSLPQQDPNARRTPRTIGPFDIDKYEYPPPFLLLPRTLAMVAPQFLNFRMLWFALNGSLVLIGLLAVAQMFDPVIGTRVLLLSPLVLAADITIGTLQMGNLQAAVFSLAMLAMVFFAQRRYAAGGALLAFVTVSKLFPGMLIVYLAVRREWRAVAWTTAFFAALVGISLLDTGRVPYVAFLDHLPRLLSGESFAAFRNNPGTVAKNLSVPGFLFKLELFGLPNGSFEVMKIVGSIYTLIVLAATIVVARRTPGRNVQPLIWLTILILASLRSPFLPRYELFAVLWLLTLLAATIVPSVRTLCLVLTAWAVLNFVIPTNSSDPRLLAAMALVSQAIIVVLLALALRHRQESSVAQPVGSPS